MIKPKSRFQAFILLLICVVFLFFLVGVIATFMGASINYYKAGVWQLGWSDISGLFPGAVAYAVPVGIGVWVLSWLKDGRGD
ncbi:hypothetical protein PSH87_16440 [Pseudomonas sp. FP453]|uniref:hypothetical protein n=1 Tax=Pseudomonas sp. FP453 TaxID=2954094 RepID=UPI002733F8F0|nr:hypothetical protein [Pseudomonas sp. FP453]WLH88249.1 hypothetical protein PSH87_16440 [Pseudomonas sp. FP453]